MASLSALRIGHLYAPEMPLVLIQLIQPQGHNAAGSFVSMKISSDPMGIRSRDLPACSAVPHPTASYLIKYSSEHSPRKCEKQFSVD